MRKTLHYCSALLLTVLFVGTSAVSSAKEISQVKRPGMADMLEEITPAVVNISVTGHTEVQLNPLFNDPTFRRFFNVPEQQQPQQRQTQSVGSGVIIDAENGYILTNYHVANDADEIEVTLQDRRQYIATLIGSDEGTDIALLQIEAEKLQDVPISDSDTLRVGDYVMAIGNPFGLGQTVTTGIVGALSRSGMNIEGYEDFIQTDASINPGNSGGALVDYNGELIGINTAIIAPSGGNVGIGFAVPINMAMSVVDQLLEYGEVKRGLLGVGITDLTPDLAQTLDLDTENGAVVQTVSPDSAAEAAGIEAGDVIVGVDGEPVRDGTHLRNMIGLVRAGTEVEIDLIRGQQRRSVKATVSSRENAPVASSMAPERSVLQGVELSTLPSNHPASGRVEGVLVTNVDQGSRAYRYQLRANDIITAVNRRPVSSPAEVESVLDGSSGAVALNIVRGDQQMFLIIR